MPAVSVIIPAYNADRTLAGTIESVLGQTMDDFEVVVVDDGSTDRTAKIAEGFGPPVRCISTPHGGVSRARNTGIEVAQGELIAFLDADDCWLPTKLERQVELMTVMPEVGLCFVGAQQVDDSLRVLGEMVAEDWADYCEALLLYSCVVTASCSSVMVRASIARSAGGFDPSLSQGADWEFWIRLSGVTRFAAISAPLVLYRFTPGSMSSDVRLLERDTMAVLEKFFSSSSSAPYLHLKRHCYSNHWMILSGSYLHAWSIKDSLRCLVKGLALYPRNVTRPLGLPYRWVRGRWSPVAVSERIRV